MVVIKYKLEDGEEPLYEINPLFRKGQNKEDEIYYNDINSDDESEAQLDFKNEVIERKIKNVNKESNEFIKEKQFLKIQKELETKKKDLASKRKEMSTFVKEELNDYKQQQIGALEKIQQYVFTITKDYDSELSCKIEELKRN
jgi:hypothetical protein